MIDRHLGGSLAVRENVRKKLRRPECGMTVSVRDVGEQHVLEDFRMRFIPSAQDYLQEIEVKEWMVSGTGCPPSFAKLFNKPKIRRVID